MSELPDDLMVRLRRIVAGERATEAELRTVVAEADGLLRLLETRLDASESRLGELSDDPDSSLADSAAELRRIDELRPALEEVRGLCAELDGRARELRTEWLLRQAGAGES